MLKRASYLAFAAVLLTRTALHASSSELTIIANRTLAVAELSRDDLARIFLLTRTSLPGAGRVEPVLEKPGPAYSAFLKEFIGRSDSALMTYYRSLLFTGRGAMPKSFASDEELIAYIARTRGAIGYVRSSAVLNSVKILKIK
ncbi:MAG TPA: hypothetical protein VKX25_20015 [Bryobacteraceae bacterium]|jgi:hypothetical protein|nr:hypothetical protein [Bryobacteraceae bacterium]